MTRPEFSFDPECYELAQYFFPAASEKRLNEIAQALQDTIEGFSDEQPAPETRTNEGYDANGSPVTETGDALFRVPGTNTGHGHVWSRPDGVKARCGGPAMCKQCALDQADSNRAKALNRSAVQAADVGGGSAE